MSAPVRVLVVDDHVLVAQGLALLLDNADDLEVVGRAGSVAAAVQVAKDTRPDVVLIDYRLPDGSGVEAAGPLREAVPGVELVLITASVEHAAVSGALEAGFSGLVPKDASPGELLAAVRAAGKGEVRFSPEVLNLLIKARRAGAMTSSADLSGRELEVLELVAAGRATGEIAAQLYLSQHTVRNHVRNILSKLNAHSKLEAVVIAARQGLIRLSEGGGLAGPGGVGGP